MWKLHNTAREKSLQNAQVNHLFVLGSKAMLWNFQCVKCMDKHVEQDDGRKCGGWEAEFQERTRKNEHAYSVDGVFVVSDPSARPYLKLAGPSSTGQTRKIQSSSKLPQVRKWKAEIQDTPLGLTGIGTTHLFLNFKVVLLPALESMWIFARFSICFFCSCLYMLNGCWMAVI